MLNSLIQKFKNSYSKNARILRRLRETVTKINAWESTMAKLSDEELQQKTLEFKERLAQDATLDDLLPEAFAVVREASSRVLGMRHFDVQLIGGIVLHQGKIAEMKTGEGKTLMSTCPIYLNALMGKGVHVVTVNDYLAGRDCEHTGILYRFLGLSVGCVLQDMGRSEKKEAYEADITYGTNNEFGFDYLRDNMKLRAEDQYQRPFFYAIVDEVDSILIDEARTPLIISGPSEKSCDLYIAVDQIIAQLNEEDYEKEEKNKNASFTEKGCIKVEELAKMGGLIKGQNLFDTENVMLVHHLNQALKARVMFHRDVDYIVKNGEVIIIDEFTGRMKTGSRYSDGLHQALEAKEGQEIEPENQTVASITFQNYFAMYPKLAGMTGTAETEAQEFSSTYGLSVVVIPTHRVLQRQDLDDEIFGTLNGKVRAVVELVKDCHKRGQPVLVGTASVEKSELFADAFGRAGIPHHVLNARHHEQEATIIARAGVPGSVTIATNMAGRGTDIQLGGNLTMEIAWALQDIEDPEARERIEKDVREKVSELAEKARAAGGLYVVGTERHESRRIDNQLRGRSGRQGDPGTSKFYLSLDDELMRIFGANLAFVKRAFLKEDSDDKEPITHPMLTRNIAKAQARVEAQHFEMRRHLLKYSKVLNDQRRAVYDERHGVMHQDPEEKVLLLQEALLADLIDLYTDERKLPDFWDLAALEDAVKRIFDIEVHLSAWIEEQVVSPDMLEERLADILKEKHLQHREKIGAEEFEKICRAQLLKTLDNVWIEHLNVMEHLREGIHLQSYGQKDPLNAFKQEAFSLFRKNVIAAWRERVVTFLYHLDPENLQGAADLDEENDFSVQDFLSFLQEQKEKMAEDTSETEDELEDADQESLKKDLFEGIGRNEFCPCGSGKRFKHCHGAIAPKVSYEE
jgi:preprotein translocase subunit SecA